MAEDERTRALRAAMGDFRAHLRDLDRLAHLAWQEAKRLHSTVIGPQEFALAILHPEAPDSIAAQALCWCGVTREGLEEITRRHRRKEEIPGGPQYSPSGTHIQYLAEGIAAGLGATEVGGEHLLLAYLWEPSYSASQLESLGTSREDVFRQLMSLGLDFPRRTLPARDPRTWGPKLEVPLDDLWILLRELWYVLPHGASFTWNHDWKKGWVSLTAGLEAKEYVERALERHRRINLPPEDSD